MCYPCEDRHIFPHFQAWSRPWLAIPGEPHTATPCIIPGACGRPSCKQLLIRRFRWIIPQAGRARAAFAAKGRCTQCTCLACTSTCAPRGDFPYKSPEIRPISAQSARLVHRISVPRTFPCTSRTCTMSARGPHEIRATLLPPVQVHRQDPYEQWSHETCGVIIFVTILHDHLPISFRNRWAFICSLVM